MAKHKRVVKMPAFPAAETSFAPLIRKVIEQLGNPVALRKVRHRLASGIGISLLPFADANAEEALRRADVALYRAKADRRSAVAAQAETRAAARVREQREQAQRKVEAEERAQAANATPHATSDLMSRMGFSAQEIAAQKAREQSLKPEAKETTDATSQAGRQSEQSRPAVNSGTPEDHLTRSHAEKPTSPSPAPDSGSH